MSDKPTSSRDNAGDKGDDKKQTNPSSPSLKSKETQILEDLTKDENTLLEREEVSDLSIEVDAPIRGEDYYQGAVGGVGTVQMTQSEIDYFLCPSVSSESNTLSSESSVDESESTTASMPSEFRNIEPVPTYTAIAEGESGNQTSNRNKSHLSSVATATTDDTDEIPSSLSRRSSEDIDQTATALVSDSVANPSSDNTSHSIPGSEKGRIINVPDDATRRDASNLENDPVASDTDSKPLEASVDQDGDNNRDFSSVERDPRTDSISVTSSEENQMQAEPNIMQSLPLSSSSITDPDESESTNASMPSELCYIEPDPTFAAIEDSEKPADLSHLSSVATNTTDDTDEIPSSLTIATSEEINLTSATALVLTSIMYQSSDNTSDSNPASIKEEIINTDDPDDDIRRDASNLENEPVAINTDRKSLEATDDSNDDSDTYRYVQSIISDISTASFSSNSQNIHGANLMPLLGLSVDPDGDTSRNLSSIERDPRSDSDSITDISNLEENKNQAEPNIIMPPLPIRHSTDADDMILPLEEGASNLTSTQTLILEPSKKLSDDSPTDSDGDMKSVSSSKRDSIPINTDRNVLELRVDSTPDSDSSYVLLRRDYRLNSNIISESVATSSQLRVQKIRKSSKDRNEDTKVGVSSLERDTSESIIDSSHDSDSSKNVSSLLTDITSESLAASSSQFGLRVREISDSSNDTDDDTSKGHPSLQRDPITSRDTIADPDDMALPREEGAASGTEEQIHHKTTITKYPTSSMLLIATMKWLTLPNEVIFHNQPAVLANLQTEVTDPPILMEYSQMKRIRESLLNKYTNIRSSEVTHTQEYNMSLPGTSTQNLEIDEKKLVINAHIQKVKTELLVIDLFDIEHDKTYTACNEILQNFALNIIPQNELSQIKIRLEEYVKVLKETQKNLVQNYEDACIEINTVKEKVNQLGKRHSSEYAEEITEMENRNSTNDKRISRLRKCISDVNTLISKL